MTMSEHTWNHRVTLIDGMFGISEVYYNENGVIELWSRHKEPMGETPEELRKDLEYFTKTLSHPILKQVGEDEMTKLILWEGK